MKLTLAGIVLILISSQSVAEECKTELSANDSYRDLSKILVCMSEKIRNLEARVNQLQSSSVAGLSESITCGPEKAEKFTASLVPTLSGSTINANFSIKNTTSEPLFLAADQHLPATLNADKLPSNIVLQGRPQGISEYAISVGGVDREQAYTRIGPGQTISVKLIFSLTNATRESGDAHVTVTMNFLNLDNGNVRKVATSPCAVMNVRN